MATISKQKLPTMNPQKPVCPRHGAEMRFDKEQTQWRCTDFSCTMTARLKDDKVDKRITNRVVTDKIEPSKVALTMIESSDDDAAYFIHAYTDNGLEFVIDVSNNVELVIDDQTNSVSLCLLFNDVRRQHK